MKHVMKLTLWLLIVLTITACAGPVSADPQDAVRIEVLGPEASEVLNLSQENWVSSEGLEFNNGQVSFELWSKNIFGKNGIAYRFGTGHGYGAEDYPEDDEAIVAVYIGENTPVYFQIRDNKLMTYISLK